MCRRSIKPLLLFLLAGAALHGHASAQDPSGTTEAVVPASAAIGSGGSRVLEVQGPVYMGDVINTDVGGEVQIRFVDETRFVVGPNSKVTIDTFVFDPNKTAQDVGISAVKGTFRFITGSSPKDVYAIRTPTMTIGVRGTAFDLAVRGGGETTIVVHEGTTDICDALRACREASAGSVVVAAPGGGLQELPAGLARTQRLAAFFPFVRSQSDLLPSFQVAAPVPLDSRGSPPDRADSDNVQDEQRVAPSFAAPAAAPASPPPDGRPPPQ